MSNKINSVIEEKDRTEFNSANSLSRKTHIPMQNGKSMRTKSNGFFTMVNSELITHLYPYF